MTWRGRWLGLTMTLLLHLVAGPALAQEGTPTSVAGDSLRMVSPSECQAAPRPIAELVAVLALDGEGVPPPPIVPITTPLGEPSDDKTAISIKEAVREVIACFNAQDLPRAAALMTDTGLQHAFWGLSSSPALRESTKARLTSPPAPRPSAVLTRLIAVTDVSQLPDGRIAAFIIVRDPLLPPAGPEAVLFVFTQQDGTWRLDGLLRLAIVPPTAAIPTPVA